MEQQNQLNKQCDSTKNSEMSEQNNKSKHHHSNLIDSENNEITELFEESCQDDSSCLEVKEKLVLLSEKMSNLTDKVDSLQKSFEKMNSSQQIISDLNHQCSLLQEQHHERDLILPLALSLIAIADRCRKQNKELEETLIKNEKAKNKPAVKALKYVIQSRQADLIELEEALANLGIESYESVENNFIPEIHKSLRKISQSKPELHFQIAERILPGYKRFERVVRKEIVNVYVNHSPLK